MCLPAAVLSPPQPPSCLPISELLILPLSYLTAHMARCQHPCNAATTELPVSYICHTFTNEERQQGVATHSFVRASETSDVKNQTLHKAAQDSSFAPHSRNIVLHYSHCARVFQLPGKKCEAKFLLVSARLYTMCDSHCKANTVN